MSQEMEIEPGPEREKPRNNHTPRAGAQNAEQPGSIPTLSDIIDDLVKLGELLVQASESLRKEKVNRMECPHCIATEEYCFSIACWVYIDSGKAAEACGDNAAPPEGEPMQLACCSNCGGYFGPKPGHVFRVIHDRPQEVPL